MLKTDEIIKNLGDEIGFSGHGSVKKIAEWLEISPNLISNWKLRDSVDVKFLTEKLTPEQYLRVVYGQSSGLTILNPGDPEQIKSGIIIEDCFRERGRALQKSPLVDKLKEVLAEWMREEDFKPLEYWKKKCGDLIDISIKEVGGE